MGEEKTFLDRDGVLVTSTRAVMGGKTFAMNGITAVQVRTQHPSGANPVIGVLMGVVGAGAAFMAVGGSAEGLAGGGGCLAFSACLMAFGGFVAYSGFTAKATYRVVLTTASGEQTGLTTREKSAADEVAAAVTEAIVARG